MNEIDTTAYGESLFAATRVAAPERPRLTFDLDVDVCVIGAGLAGLTTAREIARRGWSVAVLEAQRIAWGASGRNTGFVLPGFGQTPQAMLDRVGNERAKRLWALSQAGLEYVRDTILETNMPGIERGTGWLAVSRIDAARAVAAQTRLLGEELGASVEMWPTARVRESLKSERYFQAIHFRDAFHIHSLNYALGLAAAAEQAGARIFENTPALSMDPAGVRKRVTTPGGRVRAAHIVLAGNVYLEKLVPELAHTLLPITTYVVATERLGDRLARAIDYRGAVSDGQSADNHYRVASGDRLIWSGRMTTWQGRPEHFKRALARDIARTYPQLGKVKIDYAWSGTLGNAVHRMPQIGELSSGLWLASGFGGHGLNTTAMAGNLVARAIVEGSRTWRMFAPYELIWAGGSLGRASAQVMYWANRLKQESAARLSRRREKKRSLAMAQQERCADATWAMLKEVEVRFTATGRNSSTPIAAVREEGRMPQMTAGGGFDSRPDARIESASQAEPESLSESRSEASSESMSELAPAGGTDARQ